MRWSVVIGICFVTAGLLDGPVASAQTAGAATLPMLSLQLQTPVLLPMEDTNPSSREECDDIRSNAQRASDQIAIEHQHCLDVEQTAKVRSQPTNGDELACSQAACQGVHNAMFKARSYAKLASSYANQCLDVWDKKQEAIRLAKLEAEKRAAEEEKAERDAQQQVRDRQVAELQAEDKQRSDQEARQEAQERAQRQAEADAVARKMAAEMSAQQQKALAERTAAREQQLAELEARAAQVEAADEAKRRDAADQVASLDRRTITAETSPFGTANADSGANSFDFGDALATGKPASLAALEDKLSSILTSKVISGVKQGLGDWKTENLGDDAKDALDAGQSLYENYKELAEGREVFQRLTGEDRHESIAAMSDAASMYADHAFENPVQKWLVKQNTKQITGFYNNAFDSLDAAFAQANDAAMEPAMQAEFDDPALMIPGVRKMRAWNTYLTTKYETFTHIFSSDSAH